MPDQTGHDMAQRDVRPILAALKAVGRGDFATRLPPDQTGVPGNVAEALNEVMEFLAGSTNEFDRAGEVVGEEGKRSRRNIAAGRQRPIRKARRPG